MSTAVWCALRGQEEKSGRRWETLVGYTAAQLQTHLRSLFTAGMSWGAFLRGEIHIDHVIPQKLFRFTSASDIEFRRCWALENLQPLWSAENIAKNDKIVGTPQIALGL
jgi:hypothetical protein